MSLLKKAVKETTIFDWILLLTLLLFSLSGFVLAKRFALSGDTVIIEVNGRRVYKLSLKEDRVVDVRGPLGITRVEVTQQRIRVVDSPCPLKICMKQGWIQRGAIICLPNRVVITINGKSKSDIDAITG